MTVTKIVVSKGRSFEDADKNWIKISYELTAENTYSTSKELDKAKKILVKMIDGWLLEEKVKTPPLKQEDKSQPQIEKSLWTNYKKQPCAEGEEGYAFIDKISKTLVTQLTWQWKHIGDMEYKLGGDGKIVNRRPIK